MNAFRISHPLKTIHGSMRLPASKSLSNRALVIRWLSRDKITIHNLSKAADTVLLRDLLMTVSGHTGKRDAVMLDCQNAGTVLRFLTALLATTSGSWVLTGSDRMRQRPAGPLVEALKILGAEIGFAGEPGYPPLQISGRKLKGGSVSVDAGISSQFISAMLMIAPTLPSGLRLELAGNVSSRPYIEMTRGILKQAGIDSSFTGNTILVGPQEFTACDLHIEPDWSSAAFWYEMVALSESGGVFLEGLHPKSLQGDSLLPGIFEPLGVLTEFENTGIRLSKKDVLASTYSFDFTGHPDLVPAVAATCAGLGISARLSGLDSLRIKETDRLEALRSELGKCGIRSELRGNSEMLLPSRKIGSKDVLSKMPVFSSRGDHRMAMALAPLCLRMGDVVMDEPGVVIKSYPGFWEDLKNAGFKIKAG